MSGIMGVLSYGIGTILGVVFIGLLVFWFVQDITQKKHTVLRNYPLIGRLRYFFEKQGEYFRQYFFAGDRDEMPFNRATRGWVYRLAKDEGGIIGFGSTFDLREPGSIIFVNAPFPVLEEDRLPTPPLMIGEGYCQCRRPARPDCHDPRPDRPAGRREDRDRGLGVHQRFMQRRIEARPRSGAGFSDHRRR